MKRLPKKEYKEAVLKYRFDKKVLGKKFLKRGYIVIFLFLLLHKGPIFINSSITEGVIMDYDSYTARSGRSFTSYRITYSIAEFEVNNQHYYAISASNMDYAIGTKIKVIYDNDDPSDAKLFTFLNLFIDAMIYLPLALIIWTGLAFNLPVFFIEKPKGVSKYDLR